MKNTSRYTDKLVSDGQYLAEVMCERMAKKEGKDLYKHFWSDEKWIRPFKLQLRFANQLLKIYSFKAIINALNTFQGKKIWSLSAKWFDPIIKEEDKKLKVQAENLQLKPIQEKIEIQVPEKRKTFKEKGNLLDKLN